MTMTTPGVSRGRVLVVDDDPLVRHVLARMLQHDGFEATEAQTGEEALAQIGGCPKFDAIMSDINMPGMSGIDLLRAVRGLDLDVPVLLLTGAPSVDTAARAVEFGAYRYLVKPISPADLERTVGDAVARGRLVQVRRLAAEHLGAAASPICDRAGLEVRFQNAIDTLWMAYQPVVSVANQRVWGWEALMRTREPALPDPGAVLDAAERLGRLHDVGRAVRAQASRAVEHIGAGAFLLVNLHPHDLMDEALYHDDSPLVREAPRVILEVTERAPLEKVDNLRARVARLRELGFRVAVDDLGAGYSGLTSLAQLEPDVVKLDMSLVRGVDSQPLKQHLVDSFAALCHDLRIELIAEGVETLRERDALAIDGILLQGFLFGMPDPAFPAVNWS